MVARKDGDSDRQRAREAVPAVAGAAGRGRRPPPRRSPPLPPPPRVRRRRRRRRRRRGYPRISRGPIPRLAAGRAIRKEDLAGSKNSDTRCADLDQLHAALLPHHGLGVLLKRGCQVRVVATLAMVPLYAG